MSLDERVRRATLVLKISNTWRDEYHFEESLSIYTRGQQELGDPTDLHGDAEEKWWQCWIQIQIEIQNVYYWLAWIEKSETLFQEFTPVVERHATNLQRAVFFQLMSGVRLRANRYVPTQETFALSKTALDAKK